MQKWIKTKPVCQHYALGVCSPANKPCITVPLRECLKYPTLREMPN